MADNSDCMSRFKINKLFFFLTPIFLYNNSSAGHASYFCRCVTRHRVMLFNRRVTGHRGVLLSFFTASSTFHVTRHKFQLLKLVSRYAFTLLAVKLSPFRPAVILHTCWRLYSPPSAQRSSSTPAGGQIHPSPHPAVIFHPSPASGHPRAQLAANLTSPHPVVMFYPSPPSTE